MSDVVEFISWTCTASQDYHPNHPPKEAKKAYNAIIHGRDAKVTFARQFVGKTFVVDRSTVPALLESRDVNKRGRATDTYFILLPGPGETCTRQAISWDDAIWLATQLGLGRRLEDCWDQATGKGIPAGRVVPLAPPVEETMTKLREILGVYNPETGLVLLEQVAQELKTRL